MTPEFHRAHNLYVIELTGVNSLLSKYQYHVLPQLLQVRFRLSDINRLNFSLDFRLGNGKIAN